MTQAKKKILIAGALGLTGRAAVAKFESLGWEVVGLSRRTPAEAYRSHDAKATYVYKPAGGCAVDHQLVLISGAGHGFSNWETYTWNFLKTKATA